VLVAERAAIRVAPDTSKATVGVAIFTPIRPVVVSAVAVAEEAVIRDTPDTSKSVPGAAVFTPIRPTVVSAVLAAEPEFTRASPPDMSKRTVGAVVVVVPIFRLPLLSNRPISTPFTRNGIIFCNGSRLFTSISFCSKYIYIINTFYNIIKTANVFPVSATHPNSTD
jgi:hypothetical protein